ncbi:hypothetical protein GGR50DRAFT_694984 [Xylaria sp. CBS 124048]|nr:hypothetical protein GGR50DRAFT_694984 [Xylaria sp. CBS 124048]
MHTEDPVRCPIGRPRLRERNTVDRRPDRDLQLLPRDGVIRSGEVIDLTQDSDSPTPSPPPPRLIDPSPQQVIVNRVRVNIYTAEEHPIHYHLRTIYEVTKLRRLMTISSRPVTITTVFPTIADLIIFIKIHWEVPPPFYLEPDCRLIASRANNASYITELPIDPSQPVRLIDIRPMMLCSLDEVEVTSFHVNLYFPRKVLDDEPVRPKRKRARRAY